MAAVVVIGICLLSECITIIIIIIIIIIDVWNYQNVLLYGL